MSCLANTPCGEQQSSEDEQLQANSGSVSANNEPQDQTPPGSGVALYKNPAGNIYFCGFTYTTVTQQCLESKPCPTGVALNYCANSEGCFSAASCAEKYEAAKSPGLTETPLIKLSNCESDAPTGTLIVRFQDSCDNNCAVNVMA